MIIPYLVFAGNCAAALAFYQEVFQAQLGRCQRYGDYLPQGLEQPPPDLPEWILHAELEICGTPFWFADEAAAPVQQGNAVKLTATVPTAQEAQRIYAGLSSGARQITLPPTQTFYSRFHAGLVDQFGVSWNITALELPDPAPEAQC